ncbi:elongator complex protein 5-like [Dendronephthya gigantea]|uniref:elongator complex protein 5-like n=1 Tax=Dendronephthya gigantea TaxID=151771 RepID=UPI00106C263B|nr:elongator complex protein 5-like [Dendronephthya gigantea]XP_028394052.1 elongator complex protein 5-like [Dendronephthya gigantea]XP_028394053.1 elongator complex protein 5-like [Dendronephthya gigantea]XP_028394054.1 elongator complex protein 5-like [Dendronephthya gigantea]
MLEDLVSGKERSRFILVHDSINHRGNCILNYITQGLLKRLDIIILFQLDRHLLNFNDNRLYVYDGYMDPLKWITGRSGTTGISESISKPFFLKNIVSKHIQNDERFTSLLSDKLNKVGIIIYSLTNVIAHQDVNALCRDLFEVINFHTKTFEVSQTVALVHSDVHDENTLFPLNYIASTIIELKNHVDKKDCAGHFVTITHCKNSGKLHRKREAYQIDSECHVNVIPIEDNDTGQEPAALSEIVDISSNLTFKLSLTEEQKQARAQLQLPYLLDDRTKKTQLDLGKKSQIFYQADEVDDLDEEDPDDDLNI